MQKRAVDVVLYVQQRKQNFAFTGSFRKRGFLFGASTVVIKLGQQPEPAFALVRQLFLKPRDLGIA